MKPITRSSRISLIVGTLIRKRYRYYHIEKKEAILRGVIYAIPGQVLPHCNGDWTELELGLYEYFRTKGQPGSFNEEEMQTLTREYFSSLQATIEYITPKED